MEPSAMADHLEVKYKKIPNSRSPRTTVEISVTQRAVLVYRLPAGEALTSQMLEPLPAPVARVRTTYNMDMRAFSEFSRSKMCVLLATMICELEIIESAEELMTRARRLAAFVEEEAHRDFRTGGRVADAEVKYRFSVPRAQTVVVDEKAAALMTGSGACACSERVLRCVWFDRKTMSTPACYICLEDFVECTTVMLLPCNHGFHPMCLTVWMRRNGHCPSCCRPITYEAPGASGSNRND